MSRTLSTNEIVTFLEEARDRIADTSKHYRYSAWQHCTCGHIYKTVTGKAANELRIYDASKHSRFGQVITAVGETNVVKDVMPYSVLSAPSVVSNAVGSYHGRWHLSERKTALRFLSEVIDEMKMMDIGKQAPSRIVTPIENPVPERIPDRETIPSREPARTPERDPEQVPSR